MSLAAQAPVPAADLVFTGYPWEGVARLVDRASSVRDLRAHRLELLAAARCREGGRSTPPELADDVREAQLAALTAPVLVRRIRAVCGGPLLVFKGLEAAAHYPTPALRAFGDVDLLTPDPEAVQKQLEGAGFVQVGPELDWETLHHLPRLAHPDIPFCVEVHRRPKWAEGLQAPSTAELMADAVPSATGVEGVLAPAPPTHAVLLAAHAWAERPLGCVGDLVDVVAVAGEAGRGEAEQVARRYGVEKVWRATTSAADMLFLDGSPTWELRTWARHLAAVRDQTVLEAHLERVLAPFSALRPIPALRHAASGLASTVLPEDDETWNEKLGRARRALRNAFVRRSEHERSLRKGGEDR